MQQQRWLCLQRRVSANVSGSTIRKADPVSAATASVSTSALILRSPPSCSHVDLCALSHAVTVRQSTTMSLAPAPLLSTATTTTPTSSYTTSSNASDSALAPHALAFHSDFSPFVVLTAPPTLGRSASCGYDERPTSTGYTTAYHQQPQQCTAPPKLSRSQTTPTSIDSYFPPSVAAANEYAQLTELWSASRESLVLEPHDALLDLFIPAAAEAAVADITPTVSYVAYHAYPTTAFAIPQIARSSSDSSTCSTWSNVSAASSNGSSAGTSTQTTKIKTGSKNKKCTYAARRVRLDLVLCFSRGGNSVIQTARH